MHGRPVSRGAATAVRAKPASDDLMILSEVFLFFIGILGTVTGIAFGANSFGWIGGAVGGTIGFFGGSFAAEGLVEGYWAVRIFKERRAWRSRLRPHFGEYFAKSKTEAWGLLKEQRKIPDSVAGTVLTELYCGVFVDIGCGFPCLLSKLHFADGEDDLATGTTIAAHICDFNDHEHIVELSQHDVELTLHFAKLLEKPTRSGRRGEELPS